MLRLNLFFLIIIVGFGGQESIYAQNSWSEYKSGRIRLSIPKNWERIRHGDNSLEFIEREKSKIKANIHVAIDRINDNYDIENHFSRLVAWLQNKHKAKAQIVSKDETFTSSYNITLTLFGNKSPIKKANIIIHILGYEVITSVYATNIRNDYQSDERYSNFTNILLTNFYADRNALYTPKHYKQTKPVLAKNLIGTWFYGNVSRVVNQRPGYANDIIIESTKAIDNTGINYSFYKNGKYKLVYKAISRSSFGRLTMAFVEFGNYKIEDRKITFIPQKYSGVSSLNGKKRTYLKNRNIPIRVGVIEKLSFKKIQIKEPCAELMAETWCNKPKKYFVTYRKSQL